MEDPYLNKWLWVGGQNERSAKIEDSLSQGRRNRGGGGEIAPLPLQILAWIDVVKPFSFINSWIYYLPPRIFITSNGLESSILRV